MAMISMVKKFVATSVEYHGCALGFCWDLGTNLGSAGISIPLIDDKASGGDNMHWLSPDDVLLVIYMYDRLQGRCRTCAMINHNNEICPREEPLDGDLRIKRTEKSPKKRGCLRGNRNKKRIPIGDILDSRISELAEEDTVPEAEAEEE
ncbi:hypothetical protein ACLB2K_063423 [Fragaria x ananassa]